MSGDGGWTLDEIRLYCTDVQKSSSLYQVRSRLVEGEQQLGNLVRSLLYLHHVISLRLVISAIYKTVCTANTPILLTPHLDMNVASAKYSPSIFFSLTRAA